MTNAVPVGCRRSNMLQDAVRPTGTVCGTLGHAEEVNFMVLQCLMGEFIQS